MSYLRIRNNYDEMEKNLFRNLFDFTNYDKNVMKTDISEDENGYQFEIEMPGYSKENIKISLEKGNLTIEAVVNENEKEDTKNYVHRERFSGSITRTYYVGENIKDEDIKASFTNGVLSVYVSKENAKKLEEKKFINIE